MTLTDEIRFRCERDLKPRVKRIVRLRLGARKKYQSVVREWVRKGLERLERNTQNGKGSKINPPPTRNLPHRPARRD